MAESSTVTILSNKVEEIDGRIRAYEREIEIGLKRRYTRARCQLPFHWRDTGALSAAAVTARYCAPLLPRLLEDL